MSEEKIVVVMAGIPGSGKSHLRKHFVKHESVDAEVVSTDDLFMVDGEYEFDVSKLSEYHATCLNMFIGFVEAGIPRIYVDNTNIARWQRMNYVDIARNAGYEVEIRYIPVETIEQVKICAARNVHGVPLGTICQMALDQDWVFTSSDGVKVVKHEFRDEIGLRFEFPTMIDASHFKAKLESLGEGVNVNYLMVPADSKKPASAMARFSYASMQRVMYAAEECHGERI